MVALVQREIKQTHLKLRKLQEKQIEILAKQKEVSKLCPTRLKLQSDATNASTQQLAQHPKYNPSRVPTASAQS